jgi:DNA-binding response OmpR family regulator
MGNIPVTILTGIAWRDRVMLELLRQGVRIDDYISKDGEQPIARLASSLARLWQETIVESRILDWDPAIPLHPISISQKGRVLSKVSGYPIRASGKGVELLQVLSATPNVFVSRSELIESLYSDAQVFDQGPEDIDNALNQHVRRLRKTITEATANTISGDEIICGDRGIYWLRGLVQ